MTPGFDRPKRFEVYRANPQGVGDIDVLILSDDIVNALRSVVIVCLVEPVAKEMDLKLPTYVLLPHEETGLARESVACPASPFTMPKSALIERLLALSRRARLRVDAAIRLAYGYDDWPV